MALFLPVTGQLVAFGALTLGTGLVFFVLTRRSVDQSSRMARATGAKPEATRAKVAVMRPEPPPATQPAAGASAARPAPSAEAPVESDAFATRDSALIPPGRR
jgi:hypothetical protein